MEIETGGKKRFSIRLGGIGFILTIIFVVLKLTGVVDWPWIACFAPALISFGIGLIIIIGVLVAGGIALGGICKMVKDDMKEENQQYDRRNVVDTINDAQTIDVEPVPTPPTSQITFK